MGSISGGKLRSLAKEFNARPELDNNPQAYAAKVDLRRRVFDVIGAENARVLDCFAGSGQMWKAVWRDAPRYAGIDEKFYFDKRTSYVCDNRVLLRVIDLQPFTIFDCDAYGAPYDALLIIANRRKVAPGERIGVIVTDGSSMKMKFGGLPFSMAKLARVPPDAAGISKAQNDIREQAIVGLAAEMNCRIVRRFQADGKTGSRVLYIGMVLEGLPERT